MPFLVRRAAAADRPAILRVFAAAFGAEADPAEWSWKYDRNPCPVPSAVALDNDAVVGFYGAWGARWRGAGGTIVTAAATDVMTDPAARALGHRNLFRELGEGFVRLCREAGLPFYFGFPNERHRLLGERLLGYRSLGPTAQWARPVTEPRRSLRPSLRRIRAGERFGKAHGSLAEILHERGGWRTDRSVAVLNWRFFERPAVAYRTLQLVDVGGRSRGFAVTRIAGDRALLVDLQAHDEGSGEIPDLVEAVLADLSGSPARTLELRASPRSALAARAEELLFSPIPTDAHLEVRPLDPAFDTEKAARDFDYRFGDHEVF